MRTSLFGDVAGVARLSGAGGEMERFIVTRRISHGRARRGPVSYCDEKSGPGRACRSRVHWWVIGMAALVADPAIGSWVERESWDWDWRCWVRDLEI